MLNLFKNIVSINLWRILKQQHINQAELSRLTGISTSTINDYVKGKTLISQKNVDKIITALDIKENDLIAYSIANPLLTNSNIVLSINEDKQFIPTFPYTIITLDNDISINHKTFYKNDYLLLEKTDHYTENELVCFTNPTTHLLDIAPFSHVQSTEIHGKVIAYFSKIQ